MGNFVVIVGKFMEKFEKVLDNRSNCWKSTFLRINLITGKFLKRFRKQSVISRKLRENCEILPENLRIVRDSPFNCRKICGKLPKCIWFLCVKLLEISRKLQENTRSMYNQNIMERHPEKVKEKRTIYENFRVFHKRF